MLLEIHNEVFRVCFGSIYSDLHEPELDVPQETSDL